MCEQCAVLEDRIKRYPRISFLILDQLTVDRMRDLIADLEEQKSALHRKANE
jgi:hypothetical protein